MLHSRIKKLQKVLQLEHCVSNVKILKNPKRVVGSNFPEVVIPFFPGKCEISINDSVLDGYLTGNCPKLTPVEFWHFFIEGSISPANVVIQQLLGGIYIVARYSFGGRPAPSIAAA